MIAYEEMEPTGLFEWRFTLRLDRKHTETIYATSEVDACNQFIRLGYTLTHWTWKQIK